MCHTFANSIYYIFDPVDVAAGKLNCITELQRSAQNAEGIWLSLGNRQDKQRSAYRMPVVQFTSWNSSSHCHKYTTIFICIRRLNTTFFNDIMGDRFWS